jgi:glycosyltransferase involved in cell wall biosynthesis
MRVLYVTGQFNSGGAERQMLMTANLMSTKCKVLVLSTGSVDKSGVYLEYLSNLDVIYLNKQQGKVNNFRVIKDIVLTIKNNNIDIVHSYLGVPSLLVTLSSIFVKFKFIPSFRSSIKLDTVLWSKTNQKIIYGKNFLSTLYWFSLRSTMHAKVWIILINVIYIRAKKVHINSEFSKNTHDQIILKALRRKSFVLENLHDDTLFEQISINQRALNKSKKSISEKCLVFLCVSRLVKEKKIKEMVFGFMQSYPEGSSHVKLIIVGDGDNEYVKDLKEIIKFQRNISIKSATSKIIEYYSIADFIVIPSGWNEGMSNVLIESVSVGCIPVINKLIDKNNAIIDGENGVIFDSEVCSSIAHAFNRAINRYKILLLGQPTSRENLLRCVLVKKEYRGKLINEYNSILKKENRGKIWLK